MNKNSRFSEGLIVICNFNYSTINFFHRELFLKKFNRFVCSLQGVKLIICTYICMYFCYLYICT